MREGCTRARRGRARASVRGRSAAPGRCRRRRSGVPGLVGAGESIAPCEPITPGVSRSATTPACPVPSRARATSPPSSLHAPAPEGVQSLARLGGVMGRRTRTRPWPGTSSQRCLLGGGWRCGRPNRGRVPVRRAATVTRASSSSWPKRKPRARFRSSGRAHSRRPRLGGRPDSCLSARPGPESLETDDAHGRAISTTPTRRSSSSLRPALTPRPARPGATRPKALQASGLAGARHRKPVTKRAADATTVPGRFTRSPPSRRQPNHTARHRSRTKPLACAGSHA